MTDLRQIERNEHTDESFLAHFVSGGLLGDRLAEMIDSLFQTMQRRLYHWSSLQSKRKN